MKGKTLTERKRNAMNKLAIGAMGLMLGGLAGLAGMEYAKNSKSAKKQMMRTGKKMISKAEDVLEDMADTLH